MKKDLEPLLKANKKINFFIKKYQVSDYTTDLNLERFNYKSNC